MMSYGIPDYRLPRANLQKEIHRILAIPSVTLVSGHLVEDVTAEQQQGGFDAVFVAIGAQQANHVNIPATDGKKVVDAVSLLEQVKENKSARLGRITAIVGGGNVAMDAARTAKRLGVEEAVLIYRNDKSHLPAHPYEAGEAFAEGVKIKWLSTVDHFGADGIEIEQVEMNPDGSVTPTGKTERLAADSVVLAIVQHSDWSLFHGVDGVRFSDHGPVTETEALTPA